LKKIHKDKNGREYIKESYFVGGKMKFRRVYVIDGIPAEEFYEQNASDIDHCINGEYWKISYEKDSSRESSNKKPDLSHNESDDLPF
jgi:hypothetical protein